MDAQDPEKVLSVEQAETPLTSPISPRNDIFVQLSFPFGHFLRQTQVYSFLRVSHNTRFSCTPLCRCRIWSAELPAAEIGQCFESTLTVDCLHSDFRRGSVFLWLTV